MTLCFFMFYSRVVTLNCFNQVLVLSGFRCLHLKSFGESFHSVIDSSRGKGGYWAHIVTGLDRTPWGRCWDDGSDVTTSFAGEGRVMAWVCLVTQNPRSGKTPPAVLSSGDGASEVVPRCPRLHLPLDTF